MAQEKISKKKTNKVSDAKRHGIQAVWAFLTNSHVSGFVTGKIYTGKLKMSAYLDSTVIPVQELSEPVQ